MRQLRRTGNGLKTLAGFIGFHWRDGDPGGAQSIAWWLEYWNDPNRKRALRERVLDYNEDDVRASFALKDWLTRPPS